LCVGDLLQGEKDHALAMTAGEVVGIEGPATQRSALSTAAIRSTIVFDFVYDAEGFE
jgi:hypothetical protein